MTARIIPIRKAPDPTPGPSHNVSARGLFVPYRGASTVCPGCGRSNWWVGRVTSECAFCATAIGIVHG